MQRPRASVIVEIQNPGWAANIGEGRCRVGEGRTLLAGPSPEQVVGRYREHAADQVSAKSFVFSPFLVRDRWTTGGRDMTRDLGGLTDLAGRAPDEPRFAYERV